MGWRQLSDSYKEELFQRSKRGASLTDLSVESGITVTTLDRRLRDWASQKRGGTPVQAQQQPAREPAVAAERGLPTHEELFALIKKHDWTLEELSRKYDRSPETIRKLVVGMKEAGYVIEEAQGKVAFQGTVRPSVQVNMPKTLADEQGQVVTFAACSDLHAGSAHSQPTNHKKFLDIAYHEYGVRTVFDPGDKTTGINGYRGQEHDLIPALRSYGSKHSAAVTDAQIWLADQYTPRYPGLAYYELGGNHDYWHVVNSGKDAVAALCRQRDDMVYLGYDVADIPLTDRVDIRLWHPSGGLPYAMSYRLQKALEQTAFEELERSVVTSENPRLRILLAGHMHIEVKFSRGPMMAAHVGCFEGQTNYLKRKGLVPQLGGSIFRVWLTDSGLIQRVEYTFIPFMEIENDWADWPIPEPTQVLQDPYEIGVVFKGVEAPTFFADGRAA